MIFPILRFRIKNHSMEPFYKEGDEVLVWKFSKIKKGDVVVFRYNSKYLIKRVKKISDDNYFLVGDNKKDTLYISSIQKKDIMGKVIFKI